MAHCESFSLPIKLDKELQSRNKATKLFLRRNLLYREPDNQQQTYKSTENLTVRFSAAWCTAKAPATACRAQHLSVLLAVCTGDGSAKDLRPVSVKLINIPLLEAAPTGAAQCVHDVTLAMPEGISIVMCFVWDDFPDMMLNGFKSGNLHTLTAKQWRNMRDDQRMSKLFGMLPNGAHVWFTSLVTSPLAVPIRQKLQPGNIVGEDVVRDHWSHGVKRALKDYKVCLGCTWDDGPPSDTVAYCFDSISESMAVPAVPRAPITTAETGNVRLAYWWLYDGCKFFATESLQPWACVFCPLRMKTFRSLQHHLQATHHRLDFSFMTSNEPPPPTSIVCISFTPDSLADFVSCPPIPIAQTGEANYMVACLKAWRGVRRCWMRGRDAADQIPKDWAPAIYQILSDQASDQLSDQDECMSSHVQRPALIDLAHAHSSESADDEAVALEPHVQHAQHAQDDDLLVRFNQRYSERERTCRLHTVHMHHTDHVKLARSAAAGCIKRSVQKQRTPKKKAAKKKRKIIPPRVDPRVMQHHKDARAQGVPHNGVFLHSRTNMPMPMAEALAPPDSDTEPDAKTEERAMVQSMMVKRDLTMTERRFCYLVNAFRKRNPLRSLRQAEESYKEFCTKHGPELKQVDMHRLLFAHCVRLWKSQVLTPEAIAACFDIVHAAEPQDPVQTEDLLAWPEFQKQGHAAAAQSDTCTSV